jgi:hypothetical protein
MTLSERYRDTSLGKNPGNEGLPDGARKFQDVSASLLLAETWRQEVGFYNQTRICTNAGLDADKNNIPGLEKFEIEVSGPQSSIFKGQLHPRVEDNSWYRGLAFKVERNNPFNQVVIFSGWMQPWTGETQNPIVYTVGNVPDKTVRNVIQAYATNIASTINKLKNHYRII